MCEVTQSCPTLCDPMGHSLPGSSVHGILQAIILKWVAISTSRGSSQPRDGTCTAQVSCTWQTDSLPLAPPRTTRKIPLIPLICWLHHFHYASSSTTFITHCAASEYWPRESQKLLLCLTDGEHKCKSYPEYTVPVNHN